MSVRFYAGLKMRLWHNNAMTGDRLTHFIPTCRAEMEARGWRALDVLFVTGDAYVDHPSFGVPLLARLLESRGYRVGILAQPDWKNPDSLKGMGRPGLCACVSAGAMDSMVNRYTAAKKVRNDDAYTPGGKAGARPDRATIAYTGAVKSAFKGLPVIIGGIEASLRRWAHYDYWDNRVRRSLLIDSKADLLIYGMAERVLASVVDHLAGGGTLGELPEPEGTVQTSRALPEGVDSLPSFEGVSKDPQAYNEAFRRASEQATPERARPLAQKHGERWVLVHPPAEPLSPEELDAVYALPFQRCPHPSYTEAIPAFEQIRWSITTHRGCYGGCSFCAITAHQGKQIVSRSRLSILEEVESLVQADHFRGTVSDLGGPTANMYGTGCGNPSARRRCRRPSCLWPKICPHLVTDDREATHLLKDVRKIPKVKHAFVASGLRTDLLDQQRRYFEELIKHHTGGLLKVAPETTVTSVAQVMHKPGPESFLAFLQWFREQNRKLGRRQGVVPYLIAGHPGCTLEDMVDVALFLKKHRLKVEQVQEFTPTPGSLATCLFHTGTNPFDGSPVYIPKQAEERRLQKALLLYHRPEMKAQVEKACRQSGRADALRQLLPARPDSGSASRPRKRRPGARGRKR